MKIKYILLICLIVIVGCSSPDEGESIISGKNLGTEMHNFLTVFVHDNVAGDDLRIGNVNLSNMVDADDYEVEAYNIRLTNETKIIDHYTEEEFYYESVDLNVDYERYQWLYYGFGQRVEVKLEEEYSPVISSNRDYILFNRRLLPIYTAKEITFYPLPLEEFILNFAPVQENSYQILLVDEVRGPGFWTEFEAYEQELYMNSNLRGKVELEFLSFHFFEELPIEGDPIDIPIFYLIDNDGIVLKTEDWQDVLDYFN